MLYSKATSTLNNLTPKGTGPPSGSRAEYRAKSAALALHHGPLLGRPASLPKVAPRTRQRWPPIAHHTTDSSKHADNRRQERHDRRGNGNASARAKFALVAVKLVSVSATGSCKQKQEGIRVSTRGQRRRDREPGHVQLARRFKTPSPAGAHVTHNHRTRTRQRRSLGRPAQFPSASPPGPRQT